MNAATSPEPEPVFLFWWIRGSLAPYFTAVFVIASFLRLSFCLYNRVANDNHWEVISWILTHGGLPDTLTCSQCYHPKLYYAFVASFIRILDIDFNSPNGIIAAQMINGWAGIATLFVILAALGSAQIAERYKLYVFAFVAFNPALMVLNAQASNDTFAVLFSTIALFLLISPKRIYNASGFVCLFLALLLANVSKETALPIAFGSCIVLMLRAYFEHSAARRVYFATATGFSLLLAIAIYFLAGYYAKIVRFGTPLALNYGIAAGREGEAIAARKKPFSPAKLAESFLTFKFLTLLEKPYNQLALNGYPEHMDSLWSQIYARGNSIRFNDWPPDYAQTLPISRTITRGVFLFALIPLGALFWGAARAARSIFDGGVSYRSKEWIDLLFFVLALLFIASYNLVEYWPARSRSKAIYIFPALLAFSSLMASGFDGLSRYIDTYPLRRRLLDLGCILLLFFYLADAGSLLLQLAG